MDATVIYRADVENKSTMKEGYISDLLQKLLKNGLETIKKDFNYKQHSKNTEFSNIYGH